MKPSLSLLGLIHTVISVLPFAVGMFSLARHRTIDPRRRSGQVYLGGLLLSVVTSFGLSNSGGFNAGHALGILALAAGFGSLLVPRLTPFGRLRPYLATFGLSFSFFLLMVPAINETLTRLPRARPLADGPQSPLVLASLLAWTVAFVLGFGLQVWDLRRRRQEAALR